MMNLLLEIGQQILDAMANDVLSLEPLLERRRALIAGLDLKRATPEEQRHLREQDAALLQRAEKARQECLDELLRSMRKPQSTPEPALPRLLDVRH